jgi:hypothetical protein
MLTCAAVWLLGQQKPDEAPTDAKAQKTDKEALDFAHKRMTDAALESFKKADKQQGGHRHACHNQMLKYGVELRDWKTAEFAAGEMVAEAHGPKELAIWPSHTTKPAWS